MSDTNIKALTVDEVAERLSMGKAHVYKLIKMGEIPFLNFSSGTKQPRYKISSEDLDKFINSRKNG